MADSGVLGHEESLRLIRAAQRGDEKAKETMIVRNTALVKSIVKKFLNRGVESAWVESSVAGKHPVAIAVS